MRKRETKRNTGLKTDAFSVMVSVLAPAAGAISNVQEPANAVSPTTRCTSRRGGTDSVVSVFGDPLGTIAGSLTAAQSASGVVRKVRVRLAAWSCGRLAPTTNTIATRRTTAATSHSTTSTG